MRHYKIVKTGTIFTIVLAVLAVFLQLVSVVIFPDYFKQIKNAKAELPDYAYPDACPPSTPADVFYTFDSNTLQVNMVSKYANVGYHYQVLVYDTQASTVIGTKEGDVIQNQNPPFLVFEFPRFSVVAIDLVVNFSSDIFGGAQDCNTHYEKTLDPVTGEAGTTNLSVSPNSIDLSQDSSASFLVNYTFDNAGVQYKLSITDCAGNESTKFIVDRGTGFLQGTYEWHPDPNANQVCNHDIIIRGLDTAGEEIMSNTKRKTVSISGNTTNPVDPNAGNLNPGEVSVNDSHNLFGTNIKLATIDTGLGDIWNLIFNVLSYLIGVLAFLGIIYGGIMYVTANGDDSKAEKAKKTIIYCVIGVVLAIMAATIITLVINLVK